MHTHQLPGIGSQAAIDLNLEVSPNFKRNGLKLLATTLVLGLFIGLALIEVEILKSDKNLTNSSISASYDAQGYYFPAQFYEQEFQAEIEDLPRQF